jgi:hypothetical protein
MWMNRGLVFDVKDQGLDSQSLSFAQGPQALRLDGFTRVFFSTRVGTKESKFTSVVRFVDFTQDFTKVLRLSKGNVIAPAVLGAYDEHGIFPFNVVKVGDDVHAYICGWSRRSSVSITMSIGHAISHDGGERFKRLGRGPVVAPSLREPFLIGDPFVLHDGERFHMWYIFGTKWSMLSRGLPERTYRIGYQSSDDGHEWTRVHDGRQIIDPLDELEAQAMPTVVIVGGVAHMFFCYRNTFGFREDRSKGYRIGHALSTDLVNWSRTEVTGEDWMESGGWDSDMMCYPNVHTIGDSLFLLYNGNCFGRDGFGLVEMALGTVNGQQTLLGN